MASQEPDKIGLGVGEPGSERTFIQRKDLSRVAKMGCFFSEPELKAGGGGAGALPNWPGALCP